MRTRLVELSSRASDVSSRGKRESVFIVFHARNSWARDAIEKFLAALGLDVVEWGDAVEQTGSSSPTVIDVLTTGFKMADRVLVLLTPDDEARLRPVYLQLDERHDPAERELAPQPRPNVLFEAGYAFGRFREKTTLVQLAGLEHIRWPSDLRAVDSVELDNSPDRRSDLARRLLSREAWQEVKESEAWKQAGDFERPSETLRLVVDVPPSTASSGREVYIGGTLARLEPPAPSWVADGKKLERTDDGRWTIELMAKRGTRLDYKFTLGHWDYVEKGASCEELPDRAVYFGSRPKPGIHPDVSVYKWRTLDCGR
jgi:predicted nucleotide-binding protein